MSVVPPISDDELQRISKDLESDRAERKETPADRDKLAQAVCAFANDLPGHGLPGYLLIGVDDAGKPTALAITDSLLLRLAELRDDGNILPRPSMTVGKRVIDGVEIALVEVMPSSAPPVRYRGRTWIRVGPRRAIATVEEEARLSERRRAADLPFDARPLASASIADLDLDLFERTYLPAALAPEVLAANERSVTHQLAALRLAGSDGVPTVAGMVAIGREPASFVAGAFVQFLRIDGTELTDQVLAAHRIERPLPELLPELDELLRINIRTSVDLTSGPIELRQPDYPLVALQQLTRNALMHRSYETSTAPVRITWLSDRIEIQNPGGPFGQVTVENFGRPGVTDYRNPTIAEVMRQLGYVQRFGVGIVTAHKALAENGNPDLSFEVEATHVAVTVRPA
ncbi:MAG: ATP-binding protein [Solirubrobacteraceae bacterium]